MAGRLETIHEDAGPEYGPRHPMADDEWEKWKQGVYDLPDGTAPLPPGLTPHGRAMHHGKMQQQKTTKEMLLARIPEAEEERRRDREDRHAAMLREPLPQLDGLNQISSPELPMDEFNAQLNAQCEPQEWEQCFGAGEDSGLASTGGEAPQRTQTNCEERLKTVMEMLGELEKKMATLEQRLPRGEESKGTPTQDFLAHLTQRMHTAEKTNEELRQEITTLRGHLAKVEGQVDKQSGTITTIATACNNFVDDHAKQAAELTDSQNNGKKFRICMQAVLQHLVSTKQIDPSSMPESHQGAINSLVGNPFTAGGARTKRPAAKSPAALSSPGNSGNSGNARTKSKAAVDDWKALKVLGNHVRAIIYCMHTNDIQEVGTKRKKPHGEELLKFCKDTNAYTIAQNMYPILKKADIEYLEDHLGDDDLSKFDKMDEFYADMQEKAIALKPITVLSQLTAHPQENLEEYPPKYASMFCRVVLKRGDCSETKNVWLTFEVTMSGQLASGSEPDANWVRHGQLVRLCSDVLSNFAVKERDTLNAAKATIEFAPPPDIEEQNYGAHSIDLRKLQGHKLAKRLKRNHDMQRRISVSVLVPDPSIDTEGGVLTTPPDRKAKEMDWLDVYYPYGDVSKDVETANRICRDRNSSSMSFVLVGDARINLWSVVEEMSGLREMWEDAWKKAHSGQCPMPKDIIPWMLRAKKYNELRQNLNPVFAKPQM